MEKPIENINARNNHTYAIRLNAIASNQNAKIFV